MCLELMRELEVREFYKTIRRGKSRCSHQASQLSLPPTLLCLFFFVASADGVHLLRITDHVMGLISRETVQGLVLHFFEKSEARRGKKRQISAEVCGHVYSGVVRPL